MSAFSRPDEDWTPEQVAEQLAREEIYLIDVREEHERAAGHIEGSCHIELERLASQADSIPRDRPVVFQCRLGARSAMATRAFRTAGWDAHNLTGGAVAWVRAELPFTGEVAAH